MDGSHCNTGDTGCRIEEADGSSIYTACGRVPWHHQQEDLGCDEDPYCYVPGLELRSRCLDSTSLATNEIHAHRHQEQEERIRVVGQVDD
jgi:hypothetical protein